MPFLTSQSSVDNLHGYGHKSPAFFTDVGLTAARPNIVIVGHVNVKHKFLAKGLETGLLDSVTHAGFDGKNGPDVNLERSGFLDSFLECLLVVIGLVPHVDIVFKSKGKLAVGKRFLVA